MDVNKENTWIVFVIDKQHYAIPTHFVREMTLIARPVPIPKAPEYIRGMIDLRGTVMPVIDMRTWLGLKSGRDEIQKLIQEMHQREKDHRDWLSDLDASIEEKRPFTKATDPHKCAFGKWYDQYKSDNVFIRGLLREFDRPHKAIHSIAVQVLEANEAGRHDAAKRIIDSTRETELRTMIELFEKFCQALDESLREVSIVVEYNDIISALVVDNVEGVELLGDDFDSIKSMVGEGGQPHITSIGHRVKDDSPVLIPNIQILFEDSKHIDTEDEDSPTTIK
jgi:chemotaxis signal transduction protein